MISKLLKKKFKNNNIIYPNSKGFTILETLIAISIILLAITGPVDIIAQALKASYFSRDEITAFYLAQEVIEYTRNQRDNNALDPTTVSIDWLKNVGGLGCINLATTLEKDKTKCDLEQTSAGVYQWVTCGYDCRTSHPMYKFSNSGVYGAPVAGLGAVPTYFTREVYFTYVPLGTIPETDASGATNNREIMMTVRIYWDNSFGKGNTFSINERFFNWKITD